MASVKDIYLDIGSRHRDIQIEMQAGSGRKQSYPGPYQVHSIINEIQIFQTENKEMLENLIVMPVPYFETTNQKGGLTVYIGGE